MSLRNVGELDLNLLVVLDVLLDELSVTRAAARLGRTQSALSRSLSRLRELMDDPLLVRTREGMRPTSKAQALKAPVRRLVADATAIVAGAPSFDPRVARRSFVITCGDSAELILMPPLLAALGERAPGIDIITRRESRLSVDPLEDGQVDLLITPTAAVLSNELKRQVLWTDSFSCVVRRGHPVSDGPLDLDRYCRLRHALCAPMGTPGGIVDDALARLGRERRVVFTSPTFLAVGHAVAQSDLITTLPRQTARYFLRLFDLEILPAPLELSPFTIAQFWHERRHQDPGHAWLRQLIREVFSRAWPP
ncbi:MAG: LysR family transcriptional regulator [Myxococcota bacterium]